MQWTHPPRAPSPSPWTTCHGWGRDILAADGARFVPLAEALQDPVYALPQTYEGRWELSWLYRIEPVDETHPWDDATWNEIETRFGETRPEPPCLTTP